MPVRIVNDELNIFNGNPYILSKEERENIRFVAEAILNKPEKLTKLVKKYGKEYGVVVSDKPDTEELSTHVFGFIIANNQAFIKEFAEVMANKGNYEYQVDPASAIANAIAGVGNMFSNLFSKIGAGKDRDAAQYQANALLTAEVLKLKRERARKKTIITVAVIGGLVAISLVVIHAATGQLSPARLAK